MANSEQLFEAFSTIIQKLSSVIDEDRELRSAFRSLAESILTITEEAEECAEADMPENMVVPSDPEPFVESNIPLPTLDIGSTAESTPDAFLASHCFTKESLVSDSELIEIGKRCRLKAEGSRWMVNRQQRLLDGVDFEMGVEPIDRDIIARAKEMDCYLWMNHPNGPNPSDLSLMENVAGCFEALSEAVSVTRDLCDCRDLYGGLFERSLDLVAEAQSALRTAIELIDGPQDSDQLKTFHWLKRIAGEQQIYIKRFMRVDDPARPGGWQDVQNRVEVLDEELQANRKRDKERKNTIKKLQYHAQRIQADGSTDHDWKTIVKTIEDMLDNFVPPSNREIRDALLPVIDDMPEDIDLPSGFQLVVREIDRYLALQPSQPSQAAHDANPDVLKVGDMLKNKTVVLIGGTRRPFAHEAIKKAFQLKDIHWFESDDYQSLSTFEPYVASNDVAIVLLAIRWIRHGFCEVQRYCEKYDKPLVRLPGGYNPNQVAYQILSQCGERIGG